MSHHSIDPALLDPALLDPALLDPALLDPAFFANTQTQTDDIDRFDPSLVDSDAFDIMAPDFDPATGGSGSEQQTTSQIIDDPQNGAHTIDEHPVEHEIENGERSDEEESEPEFDIFRSNFPSIGLSYQLSAPDATTSSDLSHRHPGYSNIVSHFIKPPVQARDDEVDAADGSDAETVFDLFNSNFPKIGALSRRLTLPGETLTAHQSAELRPLEPSEDVDEAPALIEESEDVPRIPFPAPVLNRVAVQKKRKNHPKDVARDHADASIAKRRKLAAAPEAPQKVSYEGYGPAQQFYNGYAPSRMDQHDVAVPGSGPTTPYTIPTQTPQILLQQSTVPPPHYQAHVAPLPPAATGRLLFANRAQAQQAAARRHIPYNWQPPQNDRSMPQDDDHRAVYVGMLVAAFMDISQCIDSEDAGSFKSRWASLASGKSVYNEKQMETVSWKLVAIAEDLHTRGPVSLTVFDKTKLKVVANSGGWTFSERISRVCELMRLSKSRCDKLLKFENLQMVVAAPLHLITTTQRNKNQNAVRQDTLIAGRKAQKGKMEVYRDFDDKEGNAEDFEELSPAQVQPDAGPRSLGQIYGPMTLQAPNLSSTSSPGYDHHPSLMGLPPVQPTSFQSAPLAVNAGAANQFLQPSSPPPPRGRKRQAEPFDDPNFPPMPLAKRHGRKGMKPDE